MINKGKVLAVDYGSKRVGIATGDFEFGIAFPRDVFENKSLEELMSLIKDLVVELSIVLIVVGLPLNMSEEHSENKIFKGVLHFVDELKKSVNVEVELFDERLSTFEASALMKEAKEFKSGDLKKDAYAAQIILQRFFDKSKH